MILETEVVIRCEHCGNQRARGCDQHTCRECSWDGHDGPAVDCQECLTHEREG